VRGLPERQRRPRALVSGGAFFCAGRAGRFFPARGPFFFFLRLTRFVPHSPLREGVAGQRVVLGRPELSLEQPAGDPAHQPVLIGDRRPTRASC
jgi:hypothetical protein